MDVMERTEAAAVPTTSGDAWWLREFARIAAEPDPVRRAQLASHGLRQSEAFRDHCSALRDIAVADALAAEVRNKDIAEVLGVTPSLISTLSHKGDLAGTRDIVRNAIRRARRLKVTEG